jgi:LAS superfamily LD-carboxypeptidase LdcB
MMADAARRRNTPQATDLSSDTASLATQNEVLQPSVSRYKSQTDHANTTLPTATTPISTDATTPRRHIGLGSTPLTGAFPLYRDDLFSPPILACSRRS